MCCSLVSKARNMQDFSPKAAHTSSEPLMLFTDCRAYVAWVGFQECDVQFRDAVSKDPGSSRTRSLRPQWLQTFKTLGSRVCQRVDDSSRKFCIVTAIANGCAQSRCGHFSKWKS